MNATDLSVRQSRRIEKAQRARQPYVLRDCLEEFFTVARFPCRVVVCPDPRSPDIFGVVAHSEIPDCIIPRLAMAVGYDLLDTSAGPAVNGWTVGGGYTAFLLEFAPIPTFELKHSIEGNTYINLSEEEQRIQDYYGVAFAYGLGTVLGVSMGACGTRS